MGRVPSESGISYFRLPRFDEMREMNDLFDLSVSYFTVLLMSILHDEVFRRFTVPILSSSLGWRDNPFSHSQKVVRGVS